MGERRAAFPLLFPADAASSITGRRHLSLSAARVVGVPELLVLKPHSDFARLRAAASAARRDASGWSGTVYRSVTPRYAGSADLLSGFGARKHGGRWNPPGAFSAVYGSSSPETAVAEAIETFRHYRIPVADAMPRVIVAMEARLGAVLDLTDPKTRSLLRVSRRALREDAWRESQERGVESLTQAIGRSAYEAGFDGLRAPSAPVAAGWNLVVFPQRALVGALRLIGEELAGPAALGRNIS
jgi:RES domain-containing protein